MNDRAVNLLEQYDIEVLKTRKGRGAFLCDTAEGCLIFKEYPGNAEKLSLQDKLLKHLACQGDIRTEQILPNKEGTLFVQDHDGVKYILKTYTEGRECNINDRKECLDAVRLLALLHTHLEFAEGDWELQDTGFSPGAEYDKHNLELKRVRKFLKGRSQKTWFEIYLQQNYDRFMEQAFALAKEWHAYEQIRQKDLSSAACVMYCHGDYQYHNVLLANEGFFVVNFEKCIRDAQVRDLYLLMRKLLEKSDWPVSLGEELLAAYEQVRPLSALDRIDLYYRLAYPEKFWKVVNFYYNSAKAWIPDKNLEKLKKVVAQEEKRQLFLDTLFRKC